MKGTDFERLARKYLRDVLGGEYVLKGKQLREKPVGLILRGFSVDDSSFDASRFTIWVFAQPLYIPNTNVVFSIGRRLGQLGGGQEKWWTLTPDDEPATFAEIAADMREAEHLFVERCRTPGDLADFIPTIMTDGYFYAEEAMASSCILADRLDEARLHLDRLRSIMSKPTYDWERAVLARAERLARTLAADPDEAKGLLRGWAAETARALRVEDVG